MNDSPSWTIESGWFHDCFSKLDLLLIFPMIMELLSNTEAENLDFALHTLKRNLMTNLEQTWDVHTV